MFRPSGRGSLAVQMAAPHGVDITHYGVQAAGAEAVLHGALREPERQQLLARHHSMPASNQLPRRRVSPLRT